MSFFQELRQRNVFRVGVAYVLISWVLLQGGDFALDLIDAPNWVIQALVVLAVLGLLAALIFAWVFEVTPEGIKRESEIDRTQSITAHTGRKLDRVITLMLIVALAWFAWDRFGGTERVTVPESPVTEQVIEAPKPEPVVTIAEKSIAVLPFTTRSNNEEDQFFSDGMHDDLLTQLAKIGSLKVISRTSVMEYRDTIKNIRQIAQELGVATILEGAVQRSGQQVRINMQLIDAQTDEHLWAETYDRTLSVDNLFAIQSEIARAITGALQATLSPADQARLDHKLTNNLEALEAYRRANILTDYFIVEDLGRAEEELLHALELDPEFAAAWALLADVNLSRWWAIERKEEYRTAAREQIDRARVIDPGLMEVDIAEGYYYYWGFLEYEKALAVLEPLLPDNPNNTRLLEVLAYVNRRFGRVDKTLELLHQTEQLAPRALNLMYAIGETYDAMRRWDDTQRYLDKIEELDPTHPRVHELRANVLAGRDGDFRSAARFMGIAAKDLQFLRGSYWKFMVYARNFEGAMEAAELVAETDGLGENSPLGLMRGLTLHFFGNPKAAAPLLVEAKKQLTASLERKAGDHDLLYSLCSAHTALGEMEQAVAVCEDALATRPKDAINAPVQQFDIAANLAMVGATAHALELLTELTNTPIGPGRQHWLADPRLESLHDLQEWELLISRLE